MSNVVKYLDDFLIMAKDSAQCQVAMDNFLSLFQEAGIPIASQISEGPTTSLTVLGYGLDSFSGHKEHVAGPRHGNSTYEDP